MQPGGQARFMTGGQCKVPWVLRMPQGGGAGKSIAAQHSQSLEVLYAQFPGSRLCSLYPLRCQGLIRAAIRDDNPVIFLEHKMLYSVRGRVPGRGVRPAHRQMRCEAAGST